MAGLLEPQADPGEATASSPEDDGLTQRQRALEAALRERSSSLAEMFLGAIVVLAVAHNPERFAHAAHSIREIMEKLYKVVDSPVPKNPTSMGTEVRALVTAWGEGSFEITEGAAIAPELAAFLGKFVRYLDWHGVERPQRVARTAATLSGLDPSRHELPVSVQASRVEEWQACHSFFEVVSHHGSKWTTDEFERWLAYFESMMIGYLKPRTFETQAMVDELISKGEGRVS